MRGDTIVEQPSAELDALADDATHRSIERFLVCEALILDHQALSQWIPLLEPDFVYRVPVTITRDNPALSAWSEDTYLVEETRDSLSSLWARRLEPDHIEFAWGQNPLLRTRHFITNVVVFEGTARDELTVKSNVLLTVVRQSDPVEIAPAARTDVVRRRGGSWALAARTVHLDQSVVTLPHMRIVF